MERVNNPQLKDDLIPFRVGMTAKVRPGQQRRERRERNAHLLNDKRQMDPLSNLPPLPPPSLHQVGVTVIEGGKSRVQPFQAGPHTAPPLDSTQLCLSCDLANETAQVVPLYS